MNTEERHNRRETYKTRKKPPRQKRNPIESAISSWCESHAAAHLKHQHTTSDLIAQAPKRWTAYGSLVLLPAGSFTSAAWCEVLKSTAISSNAGPASDGEEEDQGPTLLWKTILAEISGLGATKLTHLAVNEGIPLHSKDSNGRVSGEEGENILRSPGGLRMLHGDFGPDGEEKREGGGGDSALLPTEDDFARAFWVSTKQNGITQTWAPRWTMFSRGNVKEKARLLRFHDPPEKKLGPNPNLGPTSQDQQSQKNGDDGSEDLISHDRHMPTSRRGDAVAVDLYAGIGYFAFSYAASGFRKVFCWELNPWSVEGLRRGAVANGWRVRVVVPPARYSVAASREKEEEEEEEISKEILEGDETIVVFLEDNARAAHRLRRLDQLSREREEERRRRRSPAGFRMSSVVHVNLGLLPTSQLSWPAAWEIASESRRAWFHIHENVGVADIDAKKGEIREWFAARARGGLDECKGNGGIVGNGKDGGGADVCVEHVELVKTFAPGVWHCVFDLCVRRGTVGGTG
ncbi:S-adenosyl-L-methionine-dependent methyltransferase [Xylaria scruposa]|nr:S-adenosyl-L-methionine-dependent methyltransferase [Xylaria scruposa]